ncbi:PREDICTED: uncharacterized protein LOC109476848 [Branchiostoma belcheri]|uniref:Uncharacterized protein LOC109476848 n=1 Tax=Branchiostoma belcheri TaxID=7741 RepID=A0A6P4ZUZ7_BRABE|nr:PREDICTED: uncharacterized protein LOC109476848 [Branchiostoma belcheri]
MNVLSIIDSDLTGHSAMSMQTKDLAKYGKLSDFLKTHTKQTHYTFQVKKCTESDCFVCNLCPPRLPADVFETMAFLPDPTLDISREHYKEFAEVYGCCTSEEDRPSLKAPNEKNETDKKRRSLLVAGKVRMAISCALCLKPRCVYSQCKLKREEEGAVRRLKSSKVYTCGNNLFEEGGRYHDTIVARVAVNCTSPVEATYYSSTLVSFPACCFHCGTVDNLLGPEDPTIATLRQQYAVVRPICLECFNDGKAPKTWGAQNMRKKRKV